MKTIDRKILDVKIIEPDLFGDERSFYFTSENAGFLYKCTNCYDPSSEIWIKWDDKKMDINWSVDIGPESFLSVKDSCALSWSEPKTQVLNL
jgi:dTDP-4-dehydrorhamnose 3,5-epimerase